MPRKPPVAIALALLLAATLPAAADETWWSDTLEIWFDEELPGYGVLVFIEDDADGLIAATGRLFLPGLTRIDASRGTYTGYWTGEGPAAPPCLMPIIDAGGATAAAWGSLTVTFSPGELPTGFRARLGHCTGPATRTFVVHPGINPVR